VALCEIVESALSKVKETCGRIHGKKLEALGIRCRLIVDSQHVNKSRNNIDKIQSCVTASAIKNLSNRDLSKIEESVFCKG
jgi:hypothetical protein